MDTPLNQEMLDLYRKVPLHRLVGNPNISRKIKIRCPIHNDRTPSMTLYPNGSWHCFGCGAHGHNAIDFCMALGSTFQEALEEIKPYI